MNESVGTSTHELKLTEKLFNQIYALGLDREHLI